MLIKCKKGCLCGSVNKDYCCLECNNFDTCKEPCMPLLNGEIDKEKVLNLCKNAIRINQ